MLWRKHGLYALDTCDRLFSYQEAVGSRPSAVHSAIHRRRQDLAGSEISS